MNRPNLATERQIRAADPTASTWLSANAGSGKTKVLTDRVARLLLGGTEPQKVLCLTYTKAAASEMQNRLLKRLGAWAMLEDGALRGELDRLGEAGPITDERLAQARRLFAQAIETPGGLKIQTIHSFCGALLRRFPLEAGVPHGFTELDDRSAAELRADVLEEIAAGPDRAVLDDLLAFHAGEDLGEIIDEIRRNRVAFRRDPDAAVLREGLGLPADFGPGDLPEIAFDGSEAALMAAVLPVLRGQSATMKKLAEVLAAIDWRAPGPAALAPLCAQFLYSKDGIRIAEAKTASLLTKGAVKELGEDLTDAFRALMERVAEARGAEFALANVGRSLALHRFARVFLPRYQARKTRAGWLDFDDLIDRAAQLLSRGSVAQWVLFRLDGGIDHILVDEAQDTSPGQWAVIERLADEFTAGEGARQETRTIFVVGDRKQSIYSFQGADLHRFEAMQSHFSAKFAAIERPLQVSELQHSFRSSPAILRLVDLTFAGEAAGGLGGVPEHIAFKTGLPGRVDLWPVIEQSKDESEDDWEAPVDLPGAEDAQVVLARTIAAEIAAMIASGTQIPEGEGARPVHEGDFLVLVQRRGPLFAEIIRACKAAGLAVAGADRLKLGAELAVKDIGSVLAFLATPEDDLSLAEALRSPIFGWSERALYALAQPRKGYLWQALRRDGTHPETLDILQDLLDQADFLRPYDVIERLLNRHGARERLIARLGVEAEDGIDELISQALAYESTEIPSLTGFLGWLGAEEIEVKRQLENEGRTVRVMTVHGAKGLEAPIVILPDTAKPRPPNGSDVYTTPEGTAYWKGPTAEMPPVLRTLHEAAIARSREERMRLLYVALTRAEKWLIVAAAGDVGTAEDSWYTLVQAGLERAGTEPVLAQSGPAQALGPVARLAQGDWPLPAAPTAATRSDAIVLPDWIRNRAPRSERPAAVLSPSDLGGAKALPGETDFATEEESKRRGRQLHLLLEHLPERPREDWPEIARDLLATGPDRTDATEAGALLSLVTPVLDRLGEIGFLGPDTLAEVEITATLPELDNQRIHGTIDRLRVTPDLVSVLDYKSNAVLPESAAEVPLGLVRQLAAYRAALRQIYPGRRIECLLVWTRSGTLTRLDDAQMDAALRTAPAS
ncbi:double-strand break repair helicase AddA [Sinirhodobacter huangdaonensis]|uniref:DNA 3'-5' helicase n=1 Tax=Paenirhodobacter huangdaonensis TaxID=2501515 RepID=A0A3S3LMT2_9RHOB|nr:double-strand break repair helicase AddA [Sinirhodobacter huangdaonensis]RWR52595.1 double-strand break repair helicase AddA [Sinirhodobacter huangdaonensis]